MERSTGRALPVLAVAVAVTAALAVGLAAGNALAEPRDSVDEARQMHEEMHWFGGGMGMGGHAAEMDEMHAEMSAQLSEEDRALHDRMHEACSLTHGRNNR